jgi:hypothetical protein
MLDLIKCIKAHKRAPALFREGMAAVAVQVRAEDEVAAEGNQGTKAMAAKVEHRGADATLDRLAAEYEGLAKDHPGLEREGDWARLAAKRASFNGVLERLLGTVAEDEKHQDDDLGAGHRKARIVALESELHDLGRGIRDLEAKGPSESESLWSGVLGG